MRGAIYAVVAAFGVLGIGAWLWHIRAADEDSLAAAVPLSNSAESGVVTLSGTAIMDTSTGYPPVPYIRYAEDDGDIATKQLIFADERGCLPGAGDIPCVPTYPAAAAYPDLATGQQIRVSGYIRANRLLITELHKEL